MDPSLIKVVAEELEYLKNWGKQTQNPEFRRGSGVLRKLLVEGAYSNAWRAVSFERQPKLIAVDIHWHLNGRPLDNLVWALAGGAEIDGLVGVAAIKWRGANLHSTRPLEGARLRINSFPGDRIYTVSEFLESPSGYNGSEVFSRREVIQYVAYIQGGVHLSNHERKKEEALIKRMKPLEKAIVVQGIIGFNLEIAAIGQALAHSEDAERFCAAVRERHP